MQNTVHHLGIWDLIWNASLVVKVVMLFLFSASVSSWAILLLKRKLILEAARQNSQFLNGFLGGWNTSEAFSRAADYPLSPVAKSFQLATRELRKFSEAGTADNNPHRGEVVLRTLKKSNIQELAALENSLSWLATTASSAPFVGLFGTVWGIMNSFQSIGAAGSANLAAVAPGISEALIATAIGLAAAIPAAIGYNYLLGKIRSQAVAMDTFNQDLLNQMQREGSI